MLHPDNAAAWNNLAHVLGRIGRTAEAIAAAHRAIGLAGDDSTPYRATLSELMPARTGAEKS